MAKKAHVVFLPHRCVWYKWSTRHANQGWKLRSEWPHRLAQQSRVRICRRANCHFAANGLLARSTARKICDHRTNEAHLAGHGESAFHHQRLRKRVQPFPWILSDTKMHGHGLIFQQHRRLRSFWCCLIEAQIKSNFHNLCYVDLRTHGCCRMEVELKKNNDWNCPLKQSIDIEKVNFIIQDTTKNTSILWTLSNSKIHGQSILSATYLLQVAYKLYWCLMKE